MKREIKFRAKRIDNGWWVYGYFFETPLTTENFESNDGKDFFDSGLNRIRPCISDKSGVVYEIDPDTVGQYTGLKDCNGKKVYGGDIIKTYEDGEDEIWGEKYHEVVWGGADYPAFTLKPGLGTEENVFSYLKLACPYNEKFEVVGNIHQNKDLL